MKDAPFKQGLISGPRASPKKKPKTTPKGKKSSAKPVKEPKTKTKVAHSPRAKKTDKKLPKKIKVVKSKKPDKKIPSVKKKTESKKRVCTKKNNTKEQKHVAKKTSKSTKKEAEVKPCRKRKLTEKTHKKGALGPPPTKMPKTSCENPTQKNRLENGISNIVPQTTHNPWVLKLGMPITPNGSAPSRGFAPVKKSAFCAPKKSTISSTFVKNNLIALNDALPKENGDLPKLANGDEPIRNAKSKMARAKKEQLSKKVKDVCKTLADNEHIVDNVKRSKIVALTPAKPAVSSHPQRMARLDALAKMHVICTTDRRTTTETTKTENVADLPHPTATTTCKESTFFCEDSTVESDVAKHKFHSRIDISVAEKQWNFVSRSIQEESCVDRRQNRSVHSSMLTPQELEQLKIMKKKRGRPKSDSHLEGPVVKKSKSGSDSSETKKLLNPTKRKDEKCSKSTKLVNHKVVKRTCRKDSSESVANKNSKAEEKRSKLKETKTQHVKVQETIRMKKTCTYQSMTVNNHHHESKSSDLPPSCVQTSGSNCTNIKKVSHVTQASDNQSDNIDSELPPRSPTMGIHCYAANVPSAEKPVSPASQPVGMEAPDCCGYHSPPLIPLAHAQSCMHMGHRMALEAHFDGGFPVHRFQQQHLVYSHPSPGDYGCCCNSCLIHSPYSHVSTHPHLLHTGHSFSSDGLCSGCHHHHHSPCSAGDSVDSVKRQYSYASGCSAHIGAWCSCYDLNSSRHGSCLYQKASPACMAADYPHQALVPCDQTPLDLSRASSSSSSSVQTPEPPLRPQCSSPLCHADHVLFKSSRECSGSSQSKASKSCCQDSPQTCKKIFRGECGSSDLPLDVKQNPQQLLQLTTNKEHKTVHIIRLRHHHHRQMTETKTSQAHLLGQGSTLVSVTEGSSSTSYVRQVAGCQDFSTCIKGGCNKEVEPHHTPSVQSLPCAPKVSPKNEIVLRQNQNRIFPSKKLVKKKFAHGWSWEGEPTDRLISLTNDAVPCLKRCYPAMRHKEGDIIKERDCVLLRSGSKDTDLPYVAKVAAFWENPEDGEMMMSLLWYYRPEHTDQGRKPGQMEDEVFASKHKDVNSVACIEDKCYVLTFAEYCRYRARLCLPENGVLTHSLIVPAPENGYPRTSRLPPDCTSPEMVFFCRSVYDFRQKRILKNPM